jgi:hypothetical protein
VFKFHFHRNPNNGPTFSKKNDIRGFDRNLYFYILEVQKLSFAFPVVTFQIDAPRLNSSGANITNMLKSENIWHNLCFRIFYDKIFVLSSEKRKSCPAAWRVHIDE